MASRERERPEEIVFLRSLTLPARRGTLLMETTPNGPRPFRAGQVFLITGLGMLVLGLSVATARYFRIRLNTSATVDRADALVGRGRVVYQVYCTSCHGPEGHGDGPSAA